MSTQPIALYLAEKLESPGVSQLLASNAAAELRRLHSVNIEAAAAEREHIVQILANNNPRNNGKAVTIYSMYGDEQFDNGWLVAVETKLFAIRARGAA